MWGSLSRIQILLRLCISAFSSPTPKPEAIVTPRNLVEDSPALIQILLLANLSGYEQKTCNITSAGEGEKKQRLCTLLRVVPNGIVAAENR